MHAILSFQPTSSGDAWMVIAMSFPLALALHWIRGVRRKIPGYWMPASLALTWVPCLLLVLGQIGCLLLRDAGYMIIPWPLLAVSVLWAAAMLVCERIRNRVIHRPLPASSAR